MIEKEIQAFLDFKAQKVGSNFTLKQYAFYLNDLDEWLDRKHYNLSDLDDKKISSFFTYKDNNFAIEANQKGIKLSPNYKNTMRACFRSFFKYLDMGLADKIEKQDVEKEFKGCVDTVGVLKIVDEPIRVDKFCNERDALIVKFLYDSGMRRAGLARARFDKFRMNGHGALLNVVEKGNKERVVGVSPEVANEYFAFRKRHGIDSQYLFFKKDGKPLCVGYITQIVVEKAQGANISIKEKNVSPHRLRASFVTEALKRGEDIRNVQVAAGHSRLDTTEIYAQPLNEEDVNRKLKRPLGVEK